jgi:hypothetical protein
VKDLLHPNLLVLVSRYGFGYVGPVLHHVLRTTERKYSTRRAPCFLVMSLACFAICIIASLFFFSSWQMNRWTIFPISFSSSISVTFDLLTSYSITSSLKKCKGKRVYLQLQYIKGQEEEKKSTSKDNEGAILPEVRFIKCPIKVSLRALSKKKNHTDNKKYRLQQD